jgi:hypothetical protein
MSSWGGTLPHKFQIYIHFVVHNVQQGVGMRCDLPKVGEQKRYRDQCAKFKKESIAYVVHKAIHCW